MELERPRRTTSTPTTTSELFICFTSRLSNSSSMRLSSKSILSPGRCTGAGDKSSSVALSTSLSRRLRHNGSLRGGQSPAMFPSKKGGGKGCSGFENPEPSSPKVTCIGQVRVKTKKQGQKMKMRACNRSKRLSNSGGEASFRRIEHGHDHGLTQQNSNQGIQNQNQTQDCSLPHRNQRWVHLPLTICEALRAFGSEFSCFLPCSSSSSCFSSRNSNEREKEEKLGVNNGKERERDCSSSSCGAMFRWLVALQEGEGGGKESRDIELVVGEEERERRERITMERECSRRRSIFDDMEFKDEIFNNGDEEIETEEEARVSISIPPKNALLLMRCRSDPMKMSALSHKLWEAPPIPPDEEEVDDEQQEEEKLLEGEVNNKESYVNELEEKTEEVVIHDERDEIDEIISQDWVLVDANVDDQEMGFDDLPPSVKQEEEEEQKQEEKTEPSQGVTEEEIEIPLMEYENMADGCLIETITVEYELEDVLKMQDLVNHTEVQEEEEQEEEENRQRTEIRDLSSSSSSSSSESTTMENEAEEKKDLDSQKKILEEEDKDPVQDQQPPLEDGKRSEQITPVNEPNLDIQKDQEEISKPVLPDCLLLMMCEPKLSMEVSKETWVCTTEFRRWLPERNHNNNKKVAAVNKTAAGGGGSDEPSSKKKKTISAVEKRAPLPPQPPSQAAAQPARSSISFPTGGGSVANLIEQKLVKAGVGVGYEPFALTRCKSAPMRSTAKIAPPELACREMEPHRPATFGVGTAGVGF